MEERNPLSGSRTANVAIVGGGIAGLTIADELTRRGVEGIAIVEAAVCGAGASGRSSGFITPASELGLYELLHRFGANDARLLWDAAQAGCDAIGETVDRHDIQCGRIAADSFYVASTERQFSAIEREHRARRSLGYRSAIYGADEVSKLLGTTSYGGGVLYDRSFAIDPHEYVCALAAAVERAGVRIYEHSRVTSLRGREITTERGTLRADVIFICVDFAAAALGICTTAAFHAQTFLTISEPLDDGTVAAIFRDRPLLVWDTDLIYQYFRLTADRRLLAGGGLLSRTYAPSRPHDPAAIDHIVRSIRRRFPLLKRVRFEFDWNGLIGVTKDFLPLAGAVGPYYVALCAAGLPWSVVAARTAIRAAFEGGDPLARFLDPQRSFTEFDLVQPVMRRPLSFALSHLYAKSALRGTAAQIARRKQIIAGASAAVAAGALLRQALLRIRERRTKDRPPSPRKPPGSP